jgi:hypothetical protein
MSLTEPIKDHTLRDRTGSLTTHGSQCTLIQLFGLSRRRLAVCDRIPLVDELSPGLIRRCPDLAVDAERRDAASEDQYQCTI